MIFILYTDHIMAPKIKKPLPEVEYSPLASVEMKNEWSFTATPLYLMFYGDSFCL